MNPDNSMEKFSLQHEHQVSYVVPESKPATIKNSFMWISPWLAAAALLLTALTMFMAYHNWWEVGLLEKEHQKLVTKVDIQSFAQERFLSDLTELMKEQENTHQYLLQELEQKMKESLEKINKELQETRDHKEQLGITKSSSPPEGKRGYDASAFSSAPSFFNASGLFCRLVLLVSSITFLLPLVGLQ